MAANPPINISHRLEQGISWSRTHPEVAATTARYREACEKLTGKKLS